MRWALTPMATLTTFAYLCHLKLAILRAITRIEEPAKVRCQNRDPHITWEPEVCILVKEGKSPPSGGYDKETFNFDLDCRLLEKE